MSRRTSRKPKNAHLASESSSSSYPQAADSAAPPPTTDNREPTTTPTTDNQQPTTTGAPVPDRRADRARKRIEDLVPTDAGTLGAPGPRLPERPRDAGTTPPTRSRACSQPQRSSSPGATSDGLSRPAEITPAVLERYQRQLYHHRKTDGDRLSFSAQRQRLAPSSGFFRWLA